MKLSGFLMAVGFLTLSAAVPAPTPTFATEVNAIPASATMTNFEAVMPESTLMPREKLEIEYHDKGPIKWGSLSRNMRLAIAAFFLWDRKLNGKPDDPIRTATSVDVVVKPVATV